MSFFPVARCEAPPATRTAITPPKESTPVAASTLQDSGVPHRQPPISPGEISMVPPAPAKPSLLTRAGQSAWQAGVSMAVSGSMSTWARTIMNRQTNEGNGFFRTGLALWREGYNQYSSARPPIRALTAIWRFNNSIPLGIPVAAATRAFDFLVMEGIKYEFPNLSRESQSLAIGTVAATGRVVFLLPFEALKNTLQTVPPRGQLYPDGKTVSLGPFNTLKYRLEHSGPASLWRGGVVTFGLHALGVGVWSFAIDHYRPFFNGLLQISSDSTKSDKVFAAAAAGASANMTSDLASQILRVIRMGQTTSRTSDSILVTAQKKGWHGLLLNGLGTKLAFSAYQGGLMMAVLAYIRHHHGDPTQKS